MNRTIRIICAWWTRLHFDKRFSRAIPSIPERKQRIAALRLSHKSTKIEIQRQQEEINSALGFRRPK